jgi:predicted PurR-regulated permease PerM
MDSSRPWHLSLKTWLSLLALGLTLWLVISYFGLIFEIIGVLLGAFLLSLAISPLADASNRWHIPRAVAVIIAYLGLGGILAGLITLLIPVVNAEVSYFQEHAPNLFQNILSNASSIPFVRNLFPSSGSLSSDLIQRIDSLVRTLITALSGIGGIALDALIVLLLAYFLTTDPSLIENFLSSWVPATSRPEILAAKESLRKRLSRWIWAQLGLAVYFSVAFSVGLTLLKVPFALTIGLVGGVLELIPYFGGFVALILAILSALTVQPLLMLWVFIFYLAVVEIEAHVLSPMLFGRVTGIHPGVLLVALLIGVKAGGILGLLFTVPVAIVLRFIIDEVQNSSAVSESNGHHHDQVEHVN